MLLDNEKLTMQFVIMEWKMNESGSRIGYYLKHLSDK